MFFQIRKLQLSFQYESYKITIIIDGVWVVLTLFFTHANYLPMVTNNFADFGQCYVFVFDASDSFLFSFFKQMMSVLILEGIMSGLFSELNVSQLSSYQCYIFRLLFSNNVFFMVYTFSWYIYKRLHLLLSVKGLVVNLAVLRCLQLISYKD